MGEEKFASLSSGLLARKGAAKPAMRRQGFINPQGDVTEDLGWNDMGFEAPRPIESDSEHQGEAPLPEVRKQQDQLAEGLNEVVEEPAEAPLPPPIDEAEPEPEPEPEPYRPNGHGGLTPMESEDIESEPAEFHAGDADDGDMPAVPDTGLRLHGRSPLSEKKSPKAKQRAETPAEAPVDTQDMAEPEDRDVPAREKVAFTLRLDKERHLKLRLASAVTNQSAQRLVTEALDQFLEQHPDVRALTGQASGGKTH
ncbi:hypothetical protein HFP57_01625 [Parasphingopyxis algicola]|uniref:hypothetical protein n=1 Tax=Parasphingopyxis algicola TaxID=2026624 RepID=UPI0015A084FF|nr:hypothetical protein [Parasphingopyxis algicola]QLC23569.1 hypothetical protein HFP57_01625 [Parasphingopyxis algicola]